MLRKVQRLVILTYSILEERGNSYEIYSIHHNK